MIGSIRSTSNSSTTRLALVFASWADENIIRIETVQDAFVACFQRTFFFSTSEIFLNNCLKFLKRLEVLLGTFGESTGTLQRPHSTGGFSSEAVPSIRARFPLLCIKGTCGRKKISKIFRTRAYSPKTDPPRRTAWPGGDSCQGSPTASRRKKRGP